MSQGGDLERQVRDYWDLDAATYDHSPGHDPQTPVELAVWRRLCAGCCLLRRRACSTWGWDRLPEPLLAREGYRVTALDLAPGMLAQLRAKAQRRSLSIEIVEGNAAEPPRDGYDAVVERTSSGPCRSPSLRSRHGTGRGRQGCSCSSRAPGVERRS